MRSGSRVPLYLTPGQVDGLTKTDWADIASSLMLLLAKRDGIKYPSKRVLFDALTTEYKRLAPNREANTDVRVGHVNDVVGAPPKALKARNCGCCVDSHDPHEWQDFDGSKYGCNGAAANLLGKAQEAK